MVPRRMANLLGDDRKQQVRALGQLGWTLRRIEEATGVRRETASAYLKAAGIAVRDPRHRHLTAPNPASEVSTDSATLPPGITGPLTWPVAGCASLAHADGHVDRVGQGEPRGLQPPGADAGETIGELFVTGLWHDHLDRCERDPVAPAELRSPHIGQ
jgi:hypothetical protein